MPRFRSTALVALLAGVAIPFAPTGADEPKPVKPGGKPAPAAEERPARDFLSVAAAIDREIDRRLAEVKVPASPQADDAEFLRRACLDIAGRIPTADRAAAFLDSTDPDKRRKLIDELLASPEFGRHLADLWRPLLAPRDPANTKPQVDRFSPWLADQFNRNRGWDRIAADLLGATGDVKDRPETTFLMTHAENAQPKADMLAAAAGRAFLGVQLQCAECHDHPFASWKQADFWGVAAFFSKVRNTGTKGPPWALTEDPDPRPLDVKNGGVQRPAVRPGGAIVIPATGGNKGAGQVIPAKVLGGEPRQLDDAAPFRPEFVTWATAKENRYFARAFVNRTWGQFFGRGLVNPVDNMHDDNPASHPAGLDLLAAEFADSGFDVKHLVRCVCNSRAYQRTSRPAAGNEADAEHFARMAVKPVGPEALYDSIMVVFGVNVDKNSPKPGAGRKPGEAKPTIKPDPGTVKPGEEPVTKPDAGKPEPGKPALKPDAAKPMPSKPEAGKPALPVNPRDEFVNFFRGQGGAEPGEFAHGIPQFLRRMNGEMFNAGGPLVDRLVKEAAGSEKAIETLFLATLSRRPTAKERELMAKYVARRPTPEQGYAGVLWVLLNSGEFVLNR
jgi:hypothetical protein